LSIVAVEKEVFRYLGFPQKELLDFDTLKKKDSALYELVCKAILESAKYLVPKKIIQTFSLVETGNVLQMGPISIVSEDLSCNLQGCFQVSVFAATIGSRIDSLIQKYSKLDVAYASVLQATGAMYIESFVDSINDEIKQEAEKEGAKVQPRFSPGYGDVSLEVQKQIFTTLRPEKIGLTLMNSLIMAPEKSVTAFVGWKKGK
jgi:hypothetical protein